MNGPDFVSVYLLMMLFSPLIDGLPSTLPPERCYWFYLNASAPYHKENKKPTSENLEKVIQILISPNDLKAHPTYHCHNTTVTLQNNAFSSSRELGKTKLNLLYKVNPHKSLKKQFAYNCVENMLYQGNLKATEVIRLLYFRGGTYIIDQNACCEEQHEYDNPCCRQGYTLENVTCFKDETNTNTQAVDKKGEVEKMEKETEDKCEPSGPMLSVGIIIIIVSGGLILFVTIVLAGMRVWKYKHRPNRSEYNQQETLTQPEVQAEDRRDTGETSCSNVPEVNKEETRNGYMKMENLSRAKLLEEESTTPPTTTSANGETPPVGRRRHTRPRSRAESLFNFDKHICIEDIQFTNKMLGRGQFGQVELAYVKINGLEKQCAVKMIRGRGTEEDERELFEELQMLYQIPHHPNVVSLLGGCMDEDSPLYVVVEYCSKGSLLKYLHKNRSSSHEYVNVSGSRLDCRWKLQRAIEICTGMTFLAQNQIIHRDLAARNILLDENEVAKISDFGMAKDVYLRGLYVKETPGFLPVRWMAIEAIESSIYTTKSDMWSFGILLWELYMDGLNPYPGITDGNELLEKYLKKGFRMLQPLNCPDSFYHLMERCWLTKPKDRPSFTHALRELKVIKDDENRRQSETSKTTEVSYAGDNEVFDEEPVSHETTTPKETPQLQGDIQTLQNSDVQINMPETESTIEIGIVNRGRSSIDSGTNFSLPFPGGRKNSIGHTSHC